MAPRELWRRWWPVAAVLTLLLALGYPLALLFGLPLARRDQRDLRKWSKALVVPAAPLELPVAGAADTLRFAAGFERGVLVRGGEPLPGAPAAAEGDPDGGEVRLAEPLAGEELVRWGAALQPLPPPSDAPAGGGGRLFVASGGSLDGPLYALGDGVARLLRPGWQTPAEVPDGRRTSFTFASAPPDGATPDTATPDTATPDGAPGEAAPGDAPLVVDGALLRAGDDYRLDAGPEGGDGDGSGGETGAAVRVTFTEPPPFGADVRRVTGDYAPLGAAVPGGVVLAAPATVELRPALHLVQLAERLEGDSDGENRRFQLARRPLPESDRERLLRLGDEPLSAVEERPEERVDGSRSEFSFASERGIVTLDGRVLREGVEYERDGARVRFTAPPPRNARLRQHPDYLLSDPLRGEVLLAEPPPAGVPLWAERYTYLAAPGCGRTLLQCFLSLPQHPVPFPHWIAARVGPFVGKYALTDERNVLRATLYTSLGTLYALALGAAVGVLLAVVFVLFRPLERALLPWVIASQTVPIIALVPVLLLVLGNFGITIQTSLLPTALIGAYIAFFPVVVGTVKGLRSVDPLALDLMRSYAASRWQVFAKVRFPAAAPFFFTSLKLGTAAALVGALVAETESNNRRGLGFQILGQVQSGNVADVWLLLILSGLLGVALVALVGLAERLLAPWRRP